MIPILSNLCLFGYKSIFFWKIWPCKRQERRNQELNWSQLFLCHCEHFPIKYEASRQNDRAFVLGVWWYQSDPLWLLHWYAISIISHQLIIYIYSFTILSINFLILWLFPRFVIIIFEIRLLILKFLFVFRNKLTTISPEIIKWLEKKTI